MNYQAVSLFFVWFFLGFWVFPLADVCAGELDATEIPTAKGGVKSGQGNKIVIRPPSTIPDPAKAQQLRELKQEVLRMAEQQEAYLRDAKTNAQIAAIGEQLKATKEYAALMGKIAEQSQNPTAKALGTGYGVINETADYVAAGTKVVLGDRSMETLLKAGEGVAAVGWKGAPEFDVLRKGKDAALASGKESTADHVQSITKGVEAGLKYMEGADPLGKTPTMKALGTAASLGSQSAKTYKQIEKAQGAMDLSTEMAVKYREGTEGPVSLAQELQAPKTPAEMRRYAERLELMAQLEDARNREPRVTPGPQSANQTKRSLEDLGFVTPKNQPLMSNPLCPKE